MQDGNVTVREAGGKFVATVDEQQLAALVQKKLRDGKVAPSFVVASREDMVRGRAEQVKVSKLSPTPYGLADNKPEFKWGPVDGALKYRVEVYDLDGYNMMPPIETESTSCQSDTALPPGRYKWVVLVSLGARSEWLWSQAQAFRVLSDREQSLIAQAKRTHPDSHLVLGTVYESLGLNDDAVQEFESLQKDNPDSKLAAKLLAGAKSGR
jgi:hypothetical protein